MSTLAVFAVLGGGAWAASKIGPEDIARNAVRTKHIKNGQVTKGKLDGGSVGAAKLTTISERSGGSGVVANGTVGEATAACLSGGVVIGGGFDATASGWRFGSSNRSGNGWRVTARNETGGNSTFTARAYCVDP